MCSLYLGDQIISGQTTLVGESRNIGQIIPSAIPLTDAGLHLLDGALIQGDGIYSAFVTYIAGIVSTYPNLFVTESAWQSAVSSKGVCGKFVYDSTNNTVRLPKITGIIEGTTDVAALGDLVEAGLPDHNHSYTYPYRTQLAPYGGDNRVCWEGNTTITKTTANASLSNSIYGNSSTVQPQTIKAFYYIVIATSTKTDIEVDIDEIATDVNGKADRDLSNTIPAISFATALDDAGIRTVIETYQNGTSWYRVWSDGWIEQGGQAQINSEGQTVTLLKNFANTNYYIGANGIQTQRYASCYNKTTSSFAVYTGDDSSFNSAPICWIACGY